MRAVLCALCSRGRSEQGQKRDGPFAVSNLLCGNNDNSSIHVSHGNNNYYNVGYSILSHGVRPDTSNTRDHYTVTYSHNIVFQACVHRGEVATSPIVLTVTLVNDVAFRRPLVIERRISTHSLPGQRPIELV